jgi:uncharacterized membrane protein/3-hydroxymyristoyl/3-hydroxydecanoyl-(acyl carrier protein) dehydratase
MAALHLLVVFAYPALIYFALRLASPRTVALCALALLGARLAFVSPDRLLAYTRFATLPAAAFAGSAVVSALRNDDLSLLLAPALVSFALLLSFGLSFLQRETVVETLARSQIGTLSPEERAYCRRVTALWCAFFVGNGTLAAQLALTSTEEAWALYNGCLSYLLMGLLFASEFVYRQWRFRRYVGAPSDVLFRRIFPPSAPGRGVRDAVAPRESAGEVPAADPPALQPEILAERHSPERWEQDLRVPEDLACWPGHFPGQPILPGVLQLDWAIKLLSRWRGGASWPHRVEQLKFKHFVRPGEVLTLTVERGPGIGFSFLLANDATTFSTGRIVLEEATRLRP